MDAFEKLRKEQYPLAEKLAYLDTPSAGMMSRAVRDAMVSYIDARYTSGAGIADVQAAWAHADAMRQPVARLFGAAPEEIFFGGAASTLISVFTSGIELKKNANVVVSGLSFPSTPYTWMNRVGKERVRIAEAENGAVAPESLFALVDEDTAAISLCSVENTTGFRHDLRTISAFCRERGIHLVLDVTQGVAAMQIDVQETPVDFLVASTFKWLGGPFGFGIGYCSKRVLDRIAPVYVGWTGNRNRMDHSRYALCLSEAANRFETGMLGWEALQALEAALKLYFALGAEAVETHILSLVDYVYEQVEALPHFSVMGNFKRENRSGVVYLEGPQDWELSDKLLLANGIRAHVSGRTLRIGVHQYNNRSDVDKLMDFLKTYR